MSLAGPLALMLALWLTGCHKEAGAPSTSTQPLPKLPVKVQTVESKTYQATEEVIGTIRAKLKATIEAKVSGRIEQLPVTVGQRVKKGDLLVQLDLREIQARLDQARAVREQAQSERQRFQTLLQQQAVTQQEFEAVQARARVADAAVVETETLLGYTRVGAPFDGVISRKLVEVGDQALPGRPLLELEDPAQLQLESDIPEALIHRLRLGDRLRLRLAAGSNELSGVVSEIAPAADPNSRTFRVKLDLGAVADLRSGQFARLSVPVAEVMALRVPASAVVVRGQMEMVFVVDKAGAQLRLVKTGKRLGDELEIVSGLAAGEVVVVSGAEPLREGQPVEVRP